MRLVFLLQRGGLAKLITPGNCDDPRRLEQFSHAYRLQKATSLPLGL